MISAGEKTALCPALKNLVRNDLNIALNKAAGDVAKDKVHSGDLMPVVATLPPGGEAVKKEDVIFTQATWGDHKYVDPSPKTISTLWSYACREDSGAVASKDTPKR